MRAFLVSMCDIFLILYLTSITNVQPATVLTVDDFYKLKSMHENLQADKKKAEEDLQEKLRREREEKEALAAEKQRQEELAAAKLKDLTGEKEGLAAKLAEEKDRIDTMKQSLLNSDAERERINKDLQEKEEMLKVREKILVDLNEQIAGQEEKWREIKASYDESQALTVQLGEEARAAQLLAEAVQVKAREEKEAKEEAERMASEAEAARQQAEAEKQKAFEGMQAAQADMKRAEQHARILAATVKEIKQDGDTAFANNIRPSLQTVNVTYERRIADGVTRYERELSLLPVKVNDKMYGVFPSKQIGFSLRADTAPDKLVITYRGQRVTAGRINKEDDLIAIPLTGYEGDARSPYPATTQLKELMPTLLALRNNGNVSLFDKVRGISDDYFIVNRDYLQMREGHGLKYNVKGLPGTGTRAERIIPGDQLVDLNGELIGIANQANLVIPVSAVGEWEEIAF